MPKKRKRSRSPSAAIPPVQFRPSPELRDALLRPIDGLCADAVFTAAALKLNELSSLRRRKNLQVQRQHVMLVAQPAVDLDPPGKRTSAPC